MTPKAAATREVIELRYGTEDELWFAFVRSLAEDGFFVAGEEAAPGVDVLLQFAVQGRESLPCRAQVLDRPSPVDRPGRYVSLQPTQSFSAFLAKKRSALKEGRSLGTAGGKRAFPRFDTCLQVEFRNYPELSIEYASNISQGGLFVRTATPPALHARVRLSVKLPNGEDVETEAVVAHVLGPEEAAARHTAPGVGLSLPAENAAFHGPFDRLIAEYQSRRPRVLVAEQDPSILTALREGLTAAGLDVDSAQDGEEAFRALINGLFQYDLMIADERLPGLDGRALVDRIRRVGGEHDLRIALLVDSETSLQNADGVSETFRRQPPSEEFVRRLLALIGR